MNYVKALEYATEMHGTTPVRIGGEKYITHPVAVADDLRTLRFKLQAFFMICLKTQMQQRKKSQL